MQLIIKIIFLKLEIFEKCDFQISFYLHLLYKI